MVDISVYRKRLELFEQMVDAIIERSESGAVIIVEGKRDVIAPRKISLWSI